MRNRLYTLGCKVNQYETQALEQIVCRGHLLVPFVRERQTPYIINTCTVTAVSDKVQTGDPPGRKRAPDAVIMMICYPRHPAKRSWRRGLSIDLVSGTEDGAGAEALLEQGPGGSASPSPPGRR